MGDGNVAVLYDTLGVEKATVSNPVQVESTTEAGILERQLLQEILGELRKLTALSAKATNTIGDP